MASNAANPPTQTDGTQPPAHYSYAQPQQYAQGGSFAMPQNFPNFQTLPPSVIPFSRPWHIAKLVLGSLSIVTSTVLIAIGIALVALYGEYSEAEADTIMACCVGGVAIVWQVAENITICARRGHRGIHPGAHVGLHLVIFLAAALIMSFMAVFLSGDVAYLEEYQAYSDCDGDSDYCDGDYGYYYYFGDLGYSDVQSYIALESSLVAFSGILMIIHLILFIRACIETHQRNSIAKTVILMPSGAPMQTPNGQVYYMPAPPQMAHMSYLQPQTQMQQQAVPPTSYAPATDVRASTINPTVLEQSHLHGYYAPPAAATARGSTVSPPVGSAVSRSPVSEAQGLEREGAHEVSGDGEGQEARYQ